jgi:CRP-like cAMP-binding protein
VQDSVPSFDLILQARFGAFAPLDEGERTFLNRIAGRPRHDHHTQARLWSDRDAFPRPEIIVSGWACTACDVGSAGRQIVEILLPGDIVGFGLQPRPFPSPAVIALTPVRTVAAPEFAAVWSERHRTPRMASRLEGMLAEQHFLMSNQIVRLGRASAYARIANLLAELHWRLAQRGLVAGADLPMPLTQDQIADTVGLSVVHVNRTLQQLRREGHIIQGKGKIRLLSLEGIHETGGFAPPVLRAA